MLPGISGSLLAGSFLDDILVGELAGRAEIRVTARQLVRWWRHVARRIGPVTSLRQIADMAAMPLCDVIGCRIQVLEPDRGLLVGAVLGPSGEPITLCVTPWGARLEGAWRIAVTAGRTTGSAWALIYSGNTLRIVDATRTWAHRAVELDLALALTDERSAGAMAGLLHATASASRPDQTLRHFVSRSDRHGATVCELLGAGVLEALTSLVAALDQAGRRQMRGRSSDRAVFEQAITVVYRLLFLLFAEARGAVPTWNHLYRTSYTIDALWHRAASTRNTRGVWKALQAISRLAHTGCRAGDLIVTPFNGRLFSPRHTPLAESSRVADEGVGHAVASLATTRGPAGRQRIAYADLDVEQLGAVYERVLEYEPRRANGSLQLARTSHDRKSSGSFYTPRAMTDFLVRRTLHPLVANKSAEQILALHVLDPAMGSGAFLVSACRYLAKAVEVALASERAFPTEPSDAERAAIRRLVAQRCLFGVDRNPMAVQLARLSLWLSTLSGDRPLTFLDHHLVNGDSLIGASVAVLGRPPRALRNQSMGAEAPLPLFNTDQSDHLARCVLPDRCRLAIAPEMTPQDVREKERVLATLSAPGTPLEAWKRTADLWCASFWDRQMISPAAYADVAHALRGDHAALRRQQIDRIVHRAAATSASQCFFHWELEFPEVFFTPSGHRDPNGGFDCVLGNPPWDVLRADTGTDDIRARCRRDQLARLKFLRKSGIYTFQNGGHANCYQLFLERALQLTRPGGRLGMIVPSGLATDHGSTTLRRHIFETLRIDRLMGFDNRASIFPIHRDIKFLLLTGTKQGPTDHVPCIFGLTQPSLLDRLPDAVSDDPLDARPIVLSRAFIDSLDPEHASLPLLKTVLDLEILARAVASVPRLAEARGWNVVFGRELNATDDRPHFRTWRGSKGGDTLPIVEGKHLEPFRVLSAVCTLGIDRSLAATLVNPERTFQRARLAYRDVASATNRVTLIAAILPAGTISTHTVFCAKRTLGDDAQYCLLALFNSLVANYLVRLQVTTHVTTSLMARLPVPKPDSTSAEFGELASLARALEQRGIGGHDDLFARLNAIAASLYGLTRTQYEHIVSTFPLLPMPLRSECVRQFEA
jgi:hypothetical protein